MGLSFFGLGKKRVLFKGCIFKNGFEDNFENYKEILDFFGVDYEVFDEVCCGFPALNAGDRKLARKLARKNFAMLKEKGVREVVVLCSVGYYMFKKFYPDLIPEWDIEVKHVTEVIHERLKKLPDFDREAVCYHDPCYFSEEGLFDVPRDVVRAFGGEILESRKNREDSFCCGAVLDGFPVLAKKMAQKRLEDFSEHCERIVVPCVLSYAHLRRFSERVVELSDFLIEKLRWIK